jgi:lambda family phage portal protein
MSLFSRIAAAFWTKPQPRSLSSVRVPSIRGSIFTGADTGRLFSDWSAGNMSPDQEVRYQFKFLRARAREMVRNDPYAVGIVNELANNVIGPNGALLQAKVANRAGDLHDDTNDAIEAAWTEWGQPEHCTADGRHSWVDVQRLTMTTLVTDGEVFIRQLPGFDNPYGYALQFVDADLVDESYNVPAGVGRNEIRMGVEVNGWNRPVAYWVWTAYLSDTNGRTRTRVRVPAEEMFHLFVSYRPNQTRGITWLAPIMANLHYLSQFEFSYLQAMRSGAANMGFIQNTSEAALEGYKPPEPGEEPRTMEVEPGNIIELLPGQQFQAFTPKTADAAYGAYTSAILRSVGRGVGMSYSTVTGDLSQANYGSQRGGLLSERDHYRYLQQWIITKEHRLAYRGWLRQALLKGAITVDSRLASDYQAVDFHPRGFKWIDPKNDLEALEMAIKLGIDCRTHAAAEQGVDFKENIDDLAAEQQYAEDAGVDVSGTQTSASGQPTGQSPTPTDATGQSPNDGTGTPRKPNARALQLAGGV